MVKKYFFSCLLISITLFAAQPPINNEDKIKKELLERAQFFEDVNSILKRELPHLKIKLRRVASMYDPSRTKFEIVIPKKAELRHERKELILHYLHQLNGASFDFAK